MITLRAPRVIGEADVVAYHVGAGKRSYALWYSPSTIQRCELAATRSWSPARCCNRGAETVVVVGRAEESLDVSTLDDLDTDAIDMKCLLLVGASATRVTTSGRMRTPRWVR